MKVRARIGSDDEMTRHTLFKGLGISNQFEGDFPEKEGDCTITCTALPGLVCPVRLEADIFSSCDS